MTVIEARPSHRIANTQAGTVTLTRAHAVTELLPNRFGVAIVQGTSYELEYPDAPTGPVEAEGETAAATIAATSGAVSAGGSRTISGITATVATVAISGMVTSGSHDTIITQSDIGGTTFSFGQTSNKQRAQSFQVGSGATLGSVSARLRDVGSPTDEVTVEIQTDNGSTQPSGTVLATTDVIAVRGAAEWHEFTLTSPLSLSTSTTYWIVVMRTGSLDSTNFYSWIHSTVDINATWKTNVLTTAWGTAGTAYDQGFTLYTP